MSDFRRHCIAWIETQDVDHPGMRVGFYVSGDEDLSPGVYDAGVLSGEVFPGSHIGDPPAGDGHVGVVGLTGIDVGQPPPADEEVRRPGALGRLQEARSLPGVHGEMGQSSAFPGGLPGEGRENTGDLPALTLGAGGALFLVFADRCLKRELLPAFVATEFVERHKRIFLPCFNALCKGWCMNFSIHISLDLSERQIFFGREVLRAASGPLTSGLPAPGGAAGGLPP